MENYFSCLFFFQAAKKNKDNLINFLNPAESFDRKNARTNQFEYKSKSKDAHDKWAVLSYGLRMSSNRHKQIKRGDKPLIMIIRQERKEQASCTKLSFFFFWIVRKKTNLKCTSIGGRVQDASKNRMEFMIPGKCITSRGFLTTTKE